MVSIVSHNAASQVQCQVGTAASCFPKPQAFPLFSQAHLSAPVFHKHTLSWTHAAAFISICGLLCTRVRASLV